MVGVCVEGCVRAFFLDSLLEMLQHLHGGRFPTELASGSVAKALQAAGGLMYGQGEGDHRPHRPRGGPHGTFPLGKAWVLEIFLKDTAYCNWIIKKGIALFILLHTEMWGSSGFAGWPSFKCRSPGSTLWNS